MTNYNNSAVYTNRKSKKNNGSEVRAAICCRLSKDDNLDGESESIQNQKLLLTDYCRGHGWNIVGVYDDDGISGLKMETRPGLQRMLNAIRMEQQCVYHDSNAVRERNCPYCRSDSGVHHDA